MSFKQVVSETTGIEAQHLQPNVFLLPDDAANLLPQAHECMLEDQELSYRCQLQPGSNKSRTCFAIRPLEVSTVAPCSPPMTFDYFHGSETWYIATFATITVIVMSFIPISWWRVHVRQRQNRQLSKKVAHVKVSELNKESCLGKRSGEMFLIASQVLH